tara:strand:- start:2887 stop:4404 length:1518 start_codon:yes stop_codon:yes gene_type:complete
MPYIGQSPDTIVSRNSFDEFNYTATNAQTLFEGSDANSQTLAYNPGNVEVFLNGVRLEEADFTATNGTSVVLASGATTGDLLSIKAVIVFEVGDAVSKSSGGTFSNNVSVTGTLTATSFSGNGGSLTGINTDLVDDTTPQLGGDLDANGKRISFSETDYQNLEALRFNGSNDALVGTYISRQNILHDFHIYNYEGDIKIQNFDNDHDIVLTSDDSSGGSANYFKADGSTGEAILYHYGSEKIKTVSTGAEITGTLNGHTIPAGAGTLALTSDIGSGDTDILTITTTSSNPSAPSSGSVNIYEDGSTLTFQNSRAGTGHYQMKMENSAGTFLFGVDGLGNAITSASGTMRAQYFYAVSNTSYYLAPAGTGTSLAVAGNAGIGGTTITDSNMLNLQGDGSAVNVGAVFNKTNGTPQIWAWQVNNTTNDFRIHNYTASTNPLVISTDGNVGIGQTNPGTSLHIKDAITNPNTISSNITIPASSNSMMAGPITLNATVTVPSGSTWTIV